MNLDELLEHAGERLDQLSHEHTFSTATMHDGPSAPPVRTSFVLVTMAAAVVLFVGVLVIVSHRSQSATPQNQPTGAGRSPTGRLLGTDVPVDVAPLVLIDGPGWTMNSVVGTEDLPLGDINTHTLVLVGSGPRFDAPVFTAWTSAPDDVMAGGTPVTVAGVDGLMVYQPFDTQTEQPGPIISLWWPLADGRLAHASSVRIDQAQSIALASALTFDADTPDIADLVGMTRLDTTSSARWLSFEYQYANGLRNVVIDGSNLGVTALEGYGFGGELLTTRTVDGVELGYRDISDEYSAVWQAGPWAYEATGNGFVSESEFLSMLSTVRLTDPASFAAAGSALDLLLPGDQLDFVRTLEIGVQLPAGTPTAEWSPTHVATTEVSFASRFFLGLACGWSRTWTSAFDAANQPGMDAAAAGVDTVVAKHAQVGDAPGWSGLAESMRTGNRDEVSSFVGDDCPTWSANIG